MAAALSLEEVRRFEEKGFVVLRQALSNALALQCRDQVLWPLLLKEQGIDRERPSTWPTHVGLKQVYFPNANQGESAHPNNSDGSRSCEGNTSSFDWQQCLTPKIQSAIDQLVGGPSRWDPSKLGFGWWFMSFPEPDRDEKEEWGVHGKWHVDGSHFSHHANSNEIGLILIFLFSNIRPQGGGTAIACGSHLEVARILLENDQDQQEGLSGSELSQWALQVPGILGCIEEITGQAGDCALIHPFALHARGRNFGATGVSDAVRFICNPSIALSEPLNLDQQEQASPVERPILEARQSLWENRPKLPVRFGKRAATLPAAHGLASQGSKRAKTKRTRSKQTLKNMRRNRNKRLRRLQQEQAT
jgi:hypothetical protein